MLTSDFAKTPRGQNNLSTITCRCQKQGQTSDLNFSDHVFAYLNQIGKLFVDDNQNGK